MTVALSIENVAKAYGGVAAIQRVDLEIEEGSIYGIVGPNGAGKSTLIDLITGFVSPDDGSIRAFSKQVSGLPPHRIAGEGVVRTFQHTSLFMEATVRENLEIAATRLGRAYRGKEREERIAELLEDTMLSERADWEVAKLAYGQQRRLAIALALVIDPRILLLDEPAAGMNPVETTAFVDLVKHISSKRTVVLIEHDMTVIRALCAQTCVLADGVVLAVGPTEEVLSREDVIEIYLGGAL